MKKGKYINKTSLEAYKRKLIEDKLNVLHYNMEYQDNLLDSKNPDFIIYKSETE